MLKRIIRFSAENKYLVIAGTLVAVAIAYWTMRNIPLDALPDLSDTQVIVYSRWDRSPDIIEDQVSYPIITALLGAPKVKTIRGYSDFGFSYVYVIFEDGTDIDSSMAGATHSAQRRTDDPQTLHARCRHSWRGDHRRVWQQQ